MKHATAWWLDLQEKMGPTWLPRIYLERILKMRTRSYDFPRLSRQAEPQIQHTLLGSLCAHGLPGGGHTLRHYGDFPDCGRIGKLMASHVAAGGQPDK